MREITFNEYKIFKKKLFAKGEYVRMTKDEIKLLSKRNLLLLIGVDCRRFDFAGRLETMMDYAPFTKTQILTKYFDIN